MVVARYVRFGAVPAALVVALATAPAHAYDMRLDGLGCRTHTMADPSRPPDYTSQELHGTMTATVADDPGANPVTVTLRCTLRTERFSFIHHGSAAEWGGEATGTPTAVLLTGVDARAGAGSEGAGSEGADGAGSGGAGSDGAGSGGAGSWGFPTSAWCVEVETTDARGVHRHLYHDAQNGGWSTDYRVYCMEYR